MADPLTTVSSAASLAARAAGFWRWLRRRAENKPDRLSRRRREPGGVEIVPIHVTIDLNTTPPRVEAQLHVINYERKDAHLSELSVARLSLAGSFAIDGVPLARHTIVAAQTSVEALCSRVLTDSEVRALRGIGSSLGRTGAISYEGTARLQNRFLTLGPVAG